MSCLQVRIKLKAPQFTRICISEFCHLPVSDTAEKDSQIEFSCDVDQWKTTHESKQQMKRDWDFLNFFSLVLVRYYFFESHGVAIRFSADYYRFFCSYAQYLKWTKSGTLWLISRTTDGTLGFVAESHKYMPLLSAMFKIVIS